MRFCFLALLFGLIDSGDSGADAGGVDLHVQEQEFLGHPYCFSGGNEYTYERCCDLALGPNGNKLCWDPLFNFEFCCHPPADVTHRDPACWQGALRNMDEFCCTGTQMTPGPRGFLECWEMAIRKGEADHDALQCCSFSEADPRRSVVSGGARCLVEGHATTCSFPGLAFRPMTVRDYPPHILAAQNPYLLRMYSDEASREPLFRFASMEPRSTDVPRTTAHLITLGVGRFTASAERLRQSALGMGVFTAVHAYTDFSFLSDFDADIWRRHMEAWEHQGAKIAGYGWWKPVLCRRHLDDPNLPEASGLVVFSDSGSRLELATVPSWDVVLSAMRRYDVLAVVEINVIERHHTKRETLRRFESALHGTGAAKEGQFITGFFILRKTAAARRLVRAWEILASDIRLVDESRDPRGEAEDFVSHRHEQSLWSLLVKCAVLGRPLQLRPGAALENVSARVLVLQYDYEAMQLVNFARSAGA